MDAYATSDFPVAVSDRAPEPPADVSLAIPRLDIFPGRPRGIYRSTQPLASSGADYRTKLPTETMFLECQQRFFDEPQGLSEPAGPGEVGNGQMRVHPTPLHSSVRRMRRVPERERPPRIVWCRSDSAHSQ